MSPSSISDAKRRLVELLKRRGPLSAREIADQLDLTGAAVRQHLQALDDRGLVESGQRPPAGRGRPAQVWSLSPLADDLFPDRHADLTVGLLSALRDSLGDDGLQTVIDTHAGRQAQAYGDAMPAGGSVKKRVEALARQRTAEGYLAEVIDEGRGSYLLVENHCPICDAATACAGLCRAELDVFRAALGDDLTVERTAHLLSGDERCVYRIRRAGQPAETEVAISTR
jgi:predicted ArsR family transcriptional regulator